MMNKKGLVAKLAESATDGGFGVSGYFLDEPFSQALMVEHVESRKKISVTELGRRAASKISEAEALRLIENAEFTRASDGSVFAVGPNGDKGLNFLILTSNQARELEVYP